MDSLDSITLGIALGFVFATAGELLTLAPLTTLGVVLVGVCLPVGLLLMTWRLVRATSRRIWMPDHFDNVDGVLHPRT